MRHKKIILFAGVVIGLGVLFYRPKNMVDNINIDSDPASSLDKASQLMNRVNDAGTKTGAGYVFNNIFPPIKTGDIKTEIYNPKTVTDLVIEKAFIIETEEDYLKKYTLANYVPNRLNAAAIAVVQAMPPDPLPPVPPKYKLHSFNVDGGFNKTYGRLGR